MNIGMFTNTYKPFVGGVPISIDRLAEGLRSLGHNVYVFAPEYTGDEAKRDDIWTVRIKRVKVKIRGSDFVIPNIFDKTLEQNFKILKLDVVHVHHPLLLGKRALEFSKKYKIPVICTYHTRYEQYLHNVFPYNRLYNHQWIPGVKGLIEITQKKWIPNKVREFLNQCETIIAPTDSIKGYLKGIGIREKIDVVPTGLTRDSFEAIEEEVKKIDRKYRGDKKYLFCTVSRITKEKNVEFIIEGLRTLKEKIGDNFNMMIIGEGTLRKALTKRLKEINLQDNVEFLGNIDNKEIKNYYRAADLFLFASKTETQGIVILEAMSGETPVVAIDSTGVSDIVINGVNGFLTKEDIKEWTSRIKEVLENRDLFRDMRENAYKRALEYGSEEIAKKMIISYNKAMVIKGEKIYEYKNSEDKVIDYNV